MKGINRTIWGLLCLASLTEPDFKAAADCPVCQDFTPVCGRILFRCRVITLFLRSSARGRLGCCLVLLLSIGLL